jgi:uncharacterized protein (DUF305 family)
MNSSTAKRLLVRAALLLVGGAALTADASGPASSNSERASLQSAASDGEALELKYLQANERAMTKMMRDMSLSPTGDADRDFVAEMIPHHRGAIDMSLALLRTGRNPQLQRLAEEIIVTQKEEIIAMCLAIGEFPPDVAGPHNNQTTDARPNYSPSSGRASIPACHRD